MTLDETMSALEQMGSEGTKKILMRHGAVEPFFGVKVGDMKQIVKKVKKDHELSLELYNTGNSDAMYLAGLIADEKKISKEDLQHWAETATYYMISEYTVAWIASESPYGWELGLKWIESDDDKISSTGWSTLASCLAITPDEDLNMEEIKSLLDRVEKEIHNAPNRTRYTMNQFVIAAGGTVAPMLESAKETASSIGKVEVMMGSTACKVPLASEYLQKMENMGRIGRKKKMARC